MKFKHTGLFQSFFTKAFYAFWILFFCMVGWRVCAEDLVTPENEKDGVYSNVYHFQIPYKAMDIGEAGLAKIELWYTLDDGASWIFYGVDADLASPVDFRCSQDGHYGFRIVASDKVGHRESPPGPGDSPDLIVMVDQRSPAVKLISPQPATEISSGQRQSV